jgi:putative flavoprotein involved in K+ transport
MGDRAAAGPGDFRLAAGRTVTFSDGSAADFDAVVWAAGFRADHTWIDIPDVRDQQGHILHTRGVTPSPGLYMLGLTWQHTCGSALLGWVGADAAFLAEQIATAN